MLDENTLDKCGYTVADLINYLSKFPADAEFDVGFNDGADTHGVEIKSCITIRVPMTVGEIKQERINFLKKTIIKHEKTIAFYADTPITKWAEKAQEAIETSKAELLQLTTP